MAKNFYAHFACKVVQYHFFCQCQYFSASLGHFVFFVLIFVFYVSELHGKHVMRTIKVTATLVIVEHNDGLRSETAAALARPPVAFV